MGFDISNDGFDAEDAAYLGGAMGFAEESMREEERGEDEETEEDLPEIPDIKEVNLRILRNTDPKLFEYVVKRAMEMAARWRKVRLEREMLSEFGFELEALEESERALNDSSDS
jgi:hypothetical protein